jgi:hypothetical protein
LAEVLLKVPVVMEVQVEVVEIRVVLALMEQQALQELAEQVVFLELRVLLLPDFLCPEQQEQMERVVLVEAEAEAEAEAVVKVVLSATMVRVMAEAEAEAEAKLVQEVPEEMAEAEALL